MEPLLTAAEMAKLDRYAIEKIGLPGAVLMETAGRGVFAHIVKSFPGVIFNGETAVVSGTGNNGGDGYVVARCLLNMGAKVAVHLVGAAKDVAGDAAVHMNAYLASGGKIFEAGGDADIPPSAKKAVLLVDALFGTGLKREAGGAHGRWIEFMNAASAPVVSVDIPSGISSDTGAVMGLAVAADLTVTFGHYKKGHFIEPGRTHAGRLELVDIGIPRQTGDIVGPGMYLTGDEDFRLTFTRGADSHKGEFGHVAVVAGGRGKTGAAALAAYGALKSGAGLSTAFFPAGLASEARFPPEVMTWPLGSGDAGPLFFGPETAGEVVDALGACDSAVVGPGMGVTEGAADFLAALLGAKGRPPMVLDADALTIIAGRDELRKKLTRDDIITPHPGEAARLLKTTGPEVQADRERAVRELAGKVKAAVILKGASTLVAQGQRPVRLVPTGNPGMATAGSGDVLSGVAGAFLARGMPPLDAATAAAYVHGLAGDLAAARAGIEGMTAGDVLESIPAAMKHLMEE